MHLTPYNRYCPLCSKDLTDYTQDQHTMSGGHFQVDRNDLAPMRSILFIACAEHAKEARDRWQIEHPSPAIDQHAGRIGMWHPSLGLAIQCSSESGEPLIPILDNEGRPVNAE